jgi:hypothetical protein
LDGALHKRHDGVPGGDGGGYQEEEQRRKPIKQHCALSEDPNRMLLPELEHPPLKMELEPEYLPLEMELKLQPLGVVAGGASHGRDRATPSGAGQ